MERGWRKLKPTPSQVRLSELPVDPSRPLPLLILVHLLDYDAGHFIGAHIPIRWAIGAK